MKQAGELIDMVVPKSTIYSEHPVVIDRPEHDSGKASGRRRRSSNYLWSDEAQKAFVKYHFRSVTNEAFNEANPEFAKIELPFTVEMFGGWDKAYPDVIQNIFREQVKSDSR